MTARYIKAWQVAVLSLATLAASPLAAQAPGASGKKVEQIYITLLVATPVADSALLDTLLPAFEDKSGHRVQVIAGLTSRILDLARKGGGDVVIGNDPESEAAFVAAGHARGRTQLMFTDLVIVGPLSDPANVAGMASVIDALRRIARSRATWHSRPEAGVLSRLEADFWAEAGLAAGRRQSWFKVIDEDVEQALRRAAKDEAYILTERAAWLRFASSGEQRVVVEGDPRMFIQHSAMLVGEAPPEKPAPAGSPPAGVDPVAHAKAVAEFFAWLTSKEGAEAIGAYRISDIQPYAPSSRDGGEGSKRAE